MQQVRARVVPRRAPAPPFVDLRLHRVSRRQIALQAAEVRDRRAHALGVLDDQAAAWTDELAAVANLAPTFRVERGPLQNHQRRLLIRGGLAHRRDRQPLHAGLVWVADELALKLRQLVIHGKGGHAYRARPFPLLAHRCVEALAIDADPRISRDLDGQVDREAKGVMQPERVRAGDASTAADALDQLCQPFAARLERPRKLALLGLDTGQDRVPTLLKVGVRVAHDVDDHPARLGQERAVYVHQPAVPHRATHDPAQDIARAFVGGVDFLPDQEGHRPRVIGDHLVAEALALDRLGIVADEGREALDDRHEQIGPVVRIDALQDRRRSLEAHPRVDALEGQRRQRAVGGAVVLHEDQVPEFEPARTRLRVIRDAFGSLAELGAPVVVQLAARSARSGIGHLPEVVVVPDRDVPPAHDPIRGQADLLGPDPEGVLVVGVDGRCQACRVDPEVIGQELPGPVDGFGLEIVAKAPVAEHLEEGLVARGPPDLFEVVVLAGDPQAGLRVDRARVVALLLAGQHALELDHAGVDEEQRRVVAGQEGGRRNAGVAARLEEALVALAKLRCRNGLHRSTCRHAPIHQESRRRPAPVSIDECGSVSGLGGLRLAARGSGLGTR